MIAIPIESMNSAEVLLKIARELYELYNSKMSELPYCMNIISELHANENANSRILRGLLQYSSNGNYLLLQSFVSMMQSKCSVDIDLKIKSPIFTNEENRIDLFIKEKNEYAIIVENKIWDAVDRKKQIERYVEYALSCSIPKNKIYVIYLTGDGSKEITDYSLTDKAKRTLRVTNKNDGRFIAMNFKDDIIPWLEEIITYDNVKSEPLLSSAIIQYTDYLKQEFGLRKEDRIIENQLEIIMMEKLQLNSLKELLDTWEEVYKLEDLLSNATNSRIKSMCETKIVKALEKKGYKIKAYSFSYDYFDLEIEISDWKKSWWAIESDNKRNLYNGIWKDPEKTIAQKHLSKLSDVYSKQETEGYISWDWMNRQLDDSFWQELEAHPVKFVNSIVSEIERVREATKGMNL